MEFLKKIFGSFKPKEEVAGIDIGSSAIKLLSVTRTSNGYACTRFFTCPTPPMTIKDGQIIDARALGGTIGDLIREAGYASPPRIVSAVSGQSVVIRPISMAQMTERELQGAIKFEAERYLPYSVTDAQVSGMILDKGENKSDDGEKKMEVLLVAAPNEMVKNTREVVQLANATPDAVDLEPFALLRAMSLGVDESILNKTVALINLGAASSSINIFKAQNLRHNRTISVAGNSFTKAIGQSLNLSFEEAEKIKKEKGVIRVENDATPVAPTTMRIFNVVIPVLTDLITEVQRSFDYYRSRYQNETVDIVILSGGTALFKNIDVYMSNELGVECQIANPFRGVSLQDVKGIDPSSIEEIAPMAMVVMGLALRS
jgi:type IV pilus assembly protein PilM